MQALNYCGLVHRKMQHQPLHQDEGFVLLVSVRITVLHGSSEEGGEEVEEGDIDIYVSIEWNEFSGNWEVVDCEQ